MTIEAVIFDFGGVIVQSEGPDALWAEWERAHGLPKGFIFQAVYLENPGWMRLRVGDGTEAGWHAAAGAAIAAGASAELAEATLAMLKEPGPVHFHDGMIDLVSKLRGRYRVGLLSNAKPGLEEDLRDHYRIDHLFHDVINSATVRLAKPDPRIYALAARRIGVPITACFFTDDLDHNILAAREAGMTAHQFSGRDGLVAALRAAGVVVD